MGIFDKIKHAIFGDEANAAEVPASSRPATPAPKIEPAQTPVSPSAAPSPAPTAQTTASTAPASPKPSAPSMAPASPMQPASVDIAVILDAAAKKSGQKLDWRHSVVDLMKAVGMDASLSERKELAAELRYSGDTSDSAAMNIWLHKALLKKLSENGGKVPADLLD